MKRQSNLALECFFRVIVHADIKLMGKFALKLWQLAHKSSNLLDSKLAVSFNEDESYFQHC